MNSSSNSRLRWTLVSDIGVLLTKIRHGHLAAHLEEKTLLRKHQAQLYSELCGYGEQRMAMNIATPIEFRLMVPSVRCANRVAEAGH